MNIVNSLLSTVNDYKIIIRKNLNLHQTCISELIWIDIFEDKRIYYGHNLEKLDHLIGSRVKSVKRYVYEKYPEINFVFLNKVSDKLKKDLFTIIFIVQDDIVVKIIGIS